MNTGRLQAEWWVRFKYLLTDLRMVERQEQTRINKNKHKQTLKLT